MLEFDKRMHLIQLQARLQGRVNGFLALQNDLNPLQYKEYWRCVDTIRKIEVYLLTAPADPRKPRPPTNLTGVV